MNTSQSRKQMVVGIFSIFMLLLAVYFHATATLEHNPWPITDERIAKEANPDDRAFLAEVRARQEAELESTKERLEYGAVAALGFASVLGFWFLRLRGRT